MEVGDYTVSVQQFNEELETLLLLPNGINKKEAGLLLLDNYISAGLVVESAKKLRYEQKKEFKEKMAYYNGQLKVQYIKFYRDGKRRDVRIKNNLAKYFQNEIKIDYVRIPSEHRELSPLMLETLKSGSSIESLLNNPEAKKWNSLGLSFYHNISIESALLNAKVLADIIRMKEGEVDVIRTKSAHYIVRCLRSMKKVNFDINQKQILLNQKMAYTLESGDTLLDKYSLQKEIVCNDKLLSKLDFSILPFTKDNVDNNTLASLFGYSVNEKEVMEKIYELPENIQSLFKNKSTRVRALSSLILSYYCNDETKDSLLHENRKEYQAVIINEVKSSGTKDTVAFLKNWISDALIKYNTNSLAEILKNENRINQTANKKKKQRTFSSVNKNQISFIQQNYYHWLHPERLTGFDNLKLNYLAVENMKITHNTTKRANEVLARAGIWKLPVEEFVKALNDLTPGNRIELSKGNNPVKMIKYIAKHEAGVRSEIEINTLLLKSIDIIGNSIDAISDVIHENDVVGSLGNVNLIVSDLRMLMNTLPEGEKNKLDNHASRRDAFNEIVMNEFWLSQNLSEEIKKRSDYEDDLRRYEDWLLAELFYKSEIQIIPDELSDGKLDIYLREAVKAINGERLKNYLREASKENKIRINNEYLANLGIDLNLSTYADVIQSIY